VHFEAARDAGMRQKLGLTVECEEDAMLAEDLLKRMAENRADYTRTFRMLCDTAAGVAGKDGVRTLFADPAAFDTWEVGWHQRLTKEPLSPQERAAQMRRVSPAFIPRNHLVEAALRAGSERQDFQPFEELLDVLAHPYDDRPGMERYSAPALPEEYVSKTFCGT
jgi:uncharacterized protein YdiU (UPF0061 family)